MSTITVPRTLLGAADVEVSRLGLGCMGLSEFYGASDEQSSLDLIRQAVELGINFFDTADIYGQGHNERLLGRAVADLHDDVVLATKFGVVRDEQGAFTGVNGRPEYVRQACDASLQRLGLDSIDLYYCHRPDPDTPIEETVGAMAELVAAGKVRHLGMSELDAPQLQRAWNTHPIVALQNEYSLWSREPEAEILPLCDELDVLMVAYSPLGRGYLTGAISGPQALDPDDWRLRNPRFSEQAMQENRRFVDTIEQIAVKHGVTAAQVALAWVAQQGEGIVAIPGTRRIERLRENLVALQIRLDGEDLAMIDERLPPGSTAGARY